MKSQGEHGNSSVSEDVYQHLTEAAPGEKADLLLALLQKRSGRRLELPQSGGGRPADFSETNLNTEALSTRLSADRIEGVSWWNAEENALSLRGADLRGANFRSADLRGIDFGEADLRGAILGGADLRGAILEDANLQGADLVGARLEEARGGGANFSEALLETARLRGAHFRFARFQYAALDQADLRETDLWGTDFEGAFLLNADLREALLHEANLQNADFTKSDLRGADLRDATLREANLREVDLRGSDLRGANLKRAVLQRAQLQGLSLVDCELEGAHLSEVRLEGTRLGRHQVGAAIGEERDGAYEAASYGYLSLEQSFGNLGDPDAERWAYLKKRTMQKLTARQAARHAFGARQWRKAIRNTFSYAQAKFVEVTCGYGESIPRTLGSIFAIYLTFTLLYGLTGSVVRTGEAEEVVRLWPLQDLANLATFALITMTAPEGPQVGMHPNGDLAHLLTSLQTLLTIGLTGLLGFVLGNRIHK